MRPYMTDLLEKHEQTNEQARLHEELEREDLQWLMQHQSGRRFVWRLFDRCGFHRPSYTGESLSTSFNEGQRNIALLVLHDLFRFCPNQYFLMLKENTEPR